jgi:hypothetical protein
VHRAGTVSTVVSQGALILAPTPIAQPAECKRHGSNDADDRAIADVTDAQQDPHCQRQCTDYL